MERRYELTEQEWERVKQLLPPENTARGRPSKPNRDMLNEIVWIAKSGAAWRDLPERFGAWQTVYERFRVWSNENVFEKIFETVRCILFLKHANIS